MTTPIIITPADRLPGRVRRGIGLGVGAFVLSVITAFWAIILWAISLGVPDESGRAIAIVFFTACAIVGFLFFAFTTIVAVLALRRNVQLGMIYASVAAIIALGALAVGIALAISIS